MIIDEFIQLEGEVTYLVCEFDELSCAHTPTHGFMEKMEEFLRFLGVKGNMNDFW